MWGMDTKDWGVLILELVLMATPTLFPTLPVPIAWMMYGIAAIILLVIIGIKLADRQNKLSNSRRPIASSLIPAQGKTPCQQFKDFLTSKLRQADGMIQADNATRDDLLHWWGKVSPAIRTALGETLFAGDESREWVRERLSDRQERIRRCYRLLEKKAASLPTYAFLDQVQVTGHFRYYRQQIERLRNEVLPVDLIHGFDPRDLHSYE